MGTVCSSLSLGTVTFTEEINPPLLRTDRNGRRSSCSKERDRKNDRGAEGKKGRIRLLNVGAFLLVLLITRLELSG